jgi:Uma2 family endonuclease
LTVLEPTGFDHGRVAGDVLVLLREHVRKLDLGVTSAAETGFVIGRDPDTVRAPDAAFVTKERYEALGSTDRFWPEAPAFAAEVLSPGDTTTEVEAKCSSS